MTMTAPHPGEIAAAAARARRGEAGAPKAPARPPAKKTTSRKKPKKD